MDPVDMPRKTIQCQPGPDGPPVARAEAAIRMRQSPRRFRFCAVCFDIVRRARAAAVSTSSRFPTIGRLPRVATHVVASRQHVRQADEHNAADDGPYDWEPMALDRYDQERRQVEVA